MKDPVEKAHNPDLCPFCVDQPFYTVEELAELLDYKSSHTVRQMISQKTFPIRTYIRTVTGQPRRVASRYAVQRYFDFWAKDSQERLQDELMRELARAEAEAQVAREQAEIENAAELERVERENAAAIQQAIDEQAARDAEILRNRSLR